MGLDFAAGNSDIDRLARALTAADGCALRSLGVDLTAVDFYWGRFVRSPITAADGCAFRSLGLDLAAADDNIAGTRTTTADGCAFVVRGGVDRTAVDGNLAGTPTTTADGCAAAGSSGVDRTAVDGNVGNAIIIISVVAAADGCATAVREPLI